MPHKTDLNKVKEHISKGETEEAADLLLDLSRNSYQEHFHSALLLKNRIETLQHNVIDGVLSASEERIEWARISKGIVELVMQIDRGEKPLSPEELFPAADNKKKAIGKSPLFHLLWVLPLVLVFGFLGIKTMSKKERKPVVNTTPKVELLNQRGRLIYPNSDPAKGITIEISPFKDGVLGKTKILSITTDEMGRFSFKYPKTLLNEQVIIQFSKGQKKLSTRTERFIPNKFNPMTIKR